MFKLLRNNELEREHLKVQLPPLYPSILGTLYGTLLLFCHLNNDRTIMQLQHESNPPNCPGDSCRNNLHIPCEGRWTEQASRDSTITSLVHFSFHSTFIKNQEQRATARGQSIFFSF